PPYPPSLHDALPISGPDRPVGPTRRFRICRGDRRDRDLLRVDPLAAGLDEREIKSHRADAAPLKRVGDRLHVAMRHARAGSVGEHDDGDRAARTLPDRAHRSVSLPPPGLGAVRAARFGNGKARALPGRPITFMLAAFTPRLRRGNNMADKKIIAVLGATGAQGGGLCRAILADPSGGFACRAITRDPSKDKAKALADQGAEVIAADLDDAESLKKAFAGAHGVFVVTNFWEHFSGEKEKAQAKNAADAARAAGVKHVIWSTLEDTRKLLPADDQRMPMLQEKYRVP